MSQHSELIDLAEAYYKVANNVREQQQHFLVVLDFCLKMGDSLSKRAADIKQGSNDDKGKD